MSGKYSAELGQSGFTRIVDTKVNHADFEATQKGEGGTSDGANTYHPNVVKWIAIKVIESAVIDHTGTVMATGDAPNSSDVLVDGDVIWGPFKKIKLTSGKVYAYIGG